MTQCKRDGCKQTAVHGPWNKRYCQDHGEDYLTKRRDYWLAWGTIPACLMCNDKVKVHRLTHGGPLVAEGNLCPKCAHNARLQDDANRKQRQFDQAETVEDLKSWMREYILK